MSDQQPIVRQQPEEIPLQNRIFPFGLLKDSTAYVAASDKVWDMSPLLSETDVSIADNPVLASRLKKIASTFGWDTPMQVPRAANHLLFTKAGNKLAAEVAVTIAAKISGTCFGEIYGGEDDENKNVLTAKATQVYHAVMSGLMFLEGRAFLQAANRYYNTKNTYDNAFLEANDVLLTQAPKVKFHNTAVSFNSSVDPESNNTAVMSTLRMASDLSNILLKAPETRELVEMVNEVHHRAMQHGAELMGFVSDTPDIASAVVMTGTSEAGHAVMTLHILINDQDIRTRLLDHTVDKFNAGNITRDDLVGFLKQYQECEAVANIKNATSASRRIRMTMPPARFLCADGGYVQWMGHPIQSPAYINAPQLVQAQSMGYVPNGPDAAGNSREFACGYWQAGPAFLPPVDPENRIYGPRDMPSRY